jgi:hypothetical protein
MKQGMGEVLLDRPIPSGIDSMVVVILVVLKMCGGLWIGEERNDGNERDRVGL